MTPPKPRLHRYIFIVICIVELASHVFDLPEVSKISKPLLMPALLFYFRKGMKVDLNTSFMLAVGALLFSFGGDALLMYQGEQLYFILGLGSFAIAQLLYLFAFRSARNEEESALPLTQQGIYTLPFVAFAFGLLWALWPTIGEMKIPVTIYAFLIMMMAIGAVFRINRTNKESFNQVFLGVIFFLLSDTLLALNKFYMPMENASLFIMATYILAQWNIINGLLKHYNRG